MEIIKDELSSLSSYDRKRESKRKKKKCFPLSKRREKIISMLQAKTFKVDTSQSDAELMLELYQSPPSQEDSYRSLDSQQNDQGEIAVYTPGQGTKILDLSEANLRSIDKIIEEKCKIVRKSPHRRAFALCMDFCYFDREIEVFSDEDQD